MGLLKQTWTLTVKNMLIAVNRHTFPTSIRAFILPVAFMIFITFARNLFIPPGLYGVGTSHAVRSLPEAFAAATGGRNNLIFINNGYSGGDIDRVIDIVSAPVIAGGNQVTRLSNLADLTSTCKSSLRGVTTCFGAVIFESSPSEGSGGKWNYTMRADGALGTSIYTNRDNNDIEVYLLPLQRAIDTAIASINTTINQATLPSIVMEYPYTDVTQTERNKQIRVGFQGTIIGALGAAFLLGMIGVVYHLTGFIATEREMGMSQLIEAMMPNAKRWQPQLARIISYHFGFSIIYAPGWIVIGIVLAAGLFAQTSKAIVIIYHILAGLSLTSWSIFGASFFKKAQLSGITVTLVTCVLAVIAQVFDQEDMSSGGVGVLSFLFVPCNYVYFMVLVARFEQQEFRTDLLHGAPNNWSLPGITFFVFLVVQIFMYPLLGIVVERFLHGTASKGRIVVRGDVDSTNGSSSSVELSGFSKHYPPNLIHRIFRKKSSTTVVAVNDLSLRAAKGQILVLLGANGSGKSTTLDAIAGMNAVTSGKITVNGTGGLGICPQKNVLWPELTVEEHIRIFNKLKAPGAYETKEGLAKLIEAVDLDRKIGAQSKTLSGGQKRKLQLGMMLTGGSAVCCVDEVSSGLDPLSRRKIWDIMLAERGSRSIILTTHFLDEADLLADHIAILSRGTLRAQGSSVELKNKLGSGYRVHVPTGPERREAPVVDGVSRSVHFDQTTYLATTSSQAALVVRTLEKLGISDYQLSGPTIEDVFLQLAEEVRSESDTSVDRLDSPNSSEQINEKGQASTSVATVLTNNGVKLELLSGRPIGFFRQAWVLFRKRLTLLKRNYLPYIAIFIIPIIAAALVTRLIKGQTLPSCAPTTAPTARYETISNQKSRYDLLAGPSSLVPIKNATLYLANLLRGYPITDLQTIAFLQPELNLVDSVSDFNNYINVNHVNVTPGGFYFGDANSPPTFAYRGNGGNLFAGIFAQNILNQQLMNISIATRYRNFETPFVPGTGNSLQLIVYFGLVMAAIPAFYSLYPTLERMRNVRGLEYSNGVRPFPLWLAYLTFDFTIWLATSILVVVLLGALSKGWYHVVYLFPIIMLFGMASILLSYIVSLFARGQLAAFAFAAGGQAVFFLLYLIAYLCVATYVPATKVDTAILIVHYTISLITPMGSLVRALFVALNLFSTTCVGTDLSNRPQALNQYGGPILYLAMQVLVFFCILLWHDSDSIVARFRGSRQKFVPEDAEAVIDEDTAEELEKVNRSSDGLRVLHLTKTFGKNTAVENLTFGIERGEVFALLGPNGAGKSTTISLIRGDIQPSRNGGNIFVDDILISAHRAQARTHLGVCPQFDAMDQLTVLEHLEFYARVRGVPNPSHNVTAVLRAVGLTAFSTRMAAKLSGGNKRKLSLGIALMGNPSVVLLDEPSSGMDAAAKRVMWKTLAGVVSGRAILLTTHSMEEAGALASRAGIMARRMLALGTTERLRRRHGERAWVHLVAKSAPRTDDEEMARLKDWVVRRWEGAEVEDKTYHGQLRFSVPCSGSGGVNSSAATTTTTRTEGTPRDEISGGNEPMAAGSFGALIMELEDAKEELGLEHYSVSPTTLDQVFLGIVGKHNVEEENYAPPKAKRGWRFWKSA